MTYFRIGALAVQIVSMGVSGCSEWGGVCTLSIEPGVVVEIRDAEDGTPIAATASGSIVDGSYQDSLRLHGALTRAGADEREGTYTVQVLHTGYVPWERRNVRVRDTGCHVDTVTLQADLQRDP